MKIYKGFIRTGTSEFVPKSRIKRITHFNYNPAKTLIVFDDKTFIVWDCTILKALKILSEVKDAN